MPIKTKVVFLVNTEVKQLKTSNMEGITKLDETRLKAIRVMNNIITLKANVFNGCYSDRAELEIEEARLEGIKKWAIENNQIQNIRHYFASKNFGSHVRFHAQEVSKIFNV